MAEATTRAGREETAYRWGVLGEDDVPAWTDLVNHLAEVDGTEEFYREEDLAEELGMSGFEPARDTVAVWDGAEMVAFASVVVPPTTDNEGNGRGYVQGGVRLGHRGRGLGREVMDRIDPRAAELVAQRHPGLPAWIRSGAGREGSSAARMLAHRGYRVVRYYDELARPLDGPVDVPATEGVELVSPGDGHEEATRLAHNDAFRDHWGSGASAPEVWHDRWTGRAVRRDVSTLAVDPDGRVLAYVLCSEWVDRELYVDLVGTVREGRGRGLARAALLRTIDLATRSGAYDVIDLEVDSENPSGATHLYESIGFVPTLRTVAMQRDLTT